MRTVILSSAIHSWCYVLKVSSTGMAINVETCELFWFLIHLHRGNNDNYVQSNMQMPLISIHSRCKVIWHRQLVLTPRNIGNCTKVCLYNFQQHHQQVTGYTFAYHPWISSLRIRKTTNLKNVQIVGQPFNMELWGGGSAIGHPPIVGILHPMITAPRSTLRSIYMLQSCQLGHWPHTIVINHLYKHRYINI